MSITLAKRVDPALGRVLPDLTETAPDAMAGLSREQLIAMIDALRSAPASRVTCKLSEKGALCIYGLGRFPFTFYLSQWEKFRASLDAIDAFVAANRDKFTVKG